MDSLIDYFRINNNNIFSFMNEEYKISLGANTKLTVYDSKNTIFGSTINEFFYKIFDSNEKDLIQRNFYLIKKINKINDENFYLMSLNSIVKENYLNAEINFNKEFMNNLSNILYLIFTKISKNNLIISKADFKSFLYEIELNKIDILNEFEENKNILKEKKYNLPNELIILVNKFQHIKKINFFINEIEEKLINNYLLILFNFSWLFPNLIEIDFDLNCDFLSNILDKIYYKKLTNKLKEINKTLKHTMYEIDKKNILIDENSSEESSIKKKSFLNSFFDENSSIFTIFSSNSEEKSNLNYKKFILNNKSHFFMILIYSYFILEMKENIKIFSLKFNDCFENEINQSLYYYYKIKNYNNFTFMNLFNDINNLIKMNFEFNSLNYKIFTNILSIFSYNKFCNNIKLNFFSDDKFYSQESLFKLCVDLNENINNLFEDKNYLDYEKNDLDHIIIYYFMEKFMKNLEFLLEIILEKKKYLNEISFILNLPSILIYDEKYLNILIKFIINFFMFLIYEKHKIQLVKIIAPLLKLDNRKIIILNDVFNIENKENLFNIKTLHLQFKIFECENIIKLITINLNSLFIGDLDIKTFVSFVEFYVKSDFKKKSQLMKITISLQFHIIKIDEEILKKFFQNPNLKLNELYFYSNLKLEKKQIFSILNIISKNSVHKYFFEFNNYNKNFIDEINNNFVQCMKYYSEFDVKKLKFFYKKLKFKFNNKNLIKKVLKFSADFLLEKRNIKLTTKNSNK